MKKLGILIFLSLLILTLSSCFSTRSDLFNLPIEEENYTLNENLEEFIVIEGKTISYINLSFKDLNKTSLINDDFELNTFGDYSFSDIKVFEIELFIGFDNEEPTKYDLTFLGRANPGRPNAYAFSTVIDELHNVTSEYRLVLDLNTHIGGAKDKIAYFLLQFNNKKKSDIGITVTLRNELQSKREESLKILKDEFESLSKENYEQENWDQIFNINKEAREAINKSLDIAEINNLLDNALADFSNIQVKETIIN